MGKYATIIGLLYFNSISANSTLGAFSSRTWAVCEISSTSSIYWQIEAAAGTSPGRLIETDSNGNIIHQFPEDVAGNENVLADNFNPHGLTVNWEKNVLLTSDFIVPLTILKPTLGKVSDNTLRLWNLSARTIISTITIPNVGHCLSRIVPWH